jgi:hypothetical protein
MLRLCSMAQYVSLCFLKTIYNERIIKFGLGDIRDISSVISLPLRLWKKARRLTCYKKSPVVGGTLKMISVRAGHRVLFLPLGDPGPYLQRP